MIEIYLDENNFQTTFPKLLTIIAQTYQALENIPSSVNIKNCSRNINWKTGKTLI